MKSRGSLGVQEGVIRCVGPSGLRSTACIAFRGSTGDRHSHVHPAPVLKLFELETVLICDPRLLVVVVVRRWLYKISLVYRHHDSGGQDTATVRGRLGSKTPHPLMFILDR